MTFGVEGMTMGVSGRLALSSRNAAFLPETREMREARRAAPAGGNGCLLPQHLAHTEV